MAGKEMARRRWGWIGVGLLALGLAACGTPQPPAGSSAATPPAPPAVDDGLADNAPADRDEAPQDAAVDNGLLPNPAAVEVALAVPDGALPGPERLMGLTGDDLKALLGAPRFVRRDRPAEIWQYGTDTCVLDLFLYAGDKGGPHRVSHFEFRGRTVAGVAPADCYRQLLATRPRAPAG